MSHGVLQNVIGVSFYRLLIALKEEKIVQWKYLVVGTLIKWCGTM